MKFTELGEETFNIGDLEVSTKSMNHPIRVLAFKFRHKGKSMIYTGDNEPYYDVLAERARPMDTGIHRRSEFIKECNQRVVDFCQGADMLVADSQYTDQEYETKRGWGHSSIEHALDFAALAGVGTLVPFHHDPSHDDDALDALYADAARGRSFPVIPAREGETLDVVRAAQLSA